MSEQPEKDVTALFENLSNEIFENPSIKIAMENFINKIEAENKKEEKAEEKAPTETQADNKADSFLSKNFMESMYAYAYHFYQQGRLDEAEILFRFLCIYDVNNVDYSFGLAAVYQLKKKYDKAIDIYSIVYTLDNPNPRALFHAGQCHLLNKQKHEAKRCFESVISESQDKWLLERAQQYISLINTGLKNQTIKIGEIPT